MRAAMFFLLVCGCNAIDGADKYSHGDGPAVCVPSCIATSGTCLTDCATTRDSCTAGCSNPGCTNKCDSNYGTCTNDCVSACTSCGCSQTDCESATPADAGSGG